MDILQKLEVIFRDVFDDEDIVLTNETTANDIEDWDSLAQINLLIAIKKEFKINFDLEEVSKYKNVGDIINAIKEKVEVGTR
ncbi:MULTISPECIES: acyl carrier protein [Fusobacterium]|jgi:acyl carrier protein|uniref:acyl carrier protein n=1 Tax=Fusobacterium TaxID=848 RepID=UPI0022E1ECFA|nr:MULTISPECIES: acyl carrier protein [Fusobacterium]